jgi:DNA-binding beta-propeller fold protein YncE
VLSGTTHKIIGTATLAANGALGGIAVNPATGNVYLANNQANHRWKLSGRTDEVTSMPRLPKNTTVAAVAIDRPISRWRSPLPRPELNRRQPRIRTAI